MLATKVHFFALHAKNVCRFFEEKTPIGLVNAGESGIFAYLLIDVVEIHYNKALAPRKSGLCKKKRMCLI